MKTSEKIQNQIENNAIILYMKGTPEAPRCGFSAKAAEIMKATGFPFAFVDVLASPRIKQALPEVSDFPTFPQLFVGGEIVGGSDIVEAMYASGELVPMLAAAQKV